MKFNILRTRELNRNKFTINKKQKLIRSLSNPNELPKSSTKKLKNSKIRTRLETSRFKFNSRRYLSKNANAWKWSATKRLRN